MYNYYVKYLYIREIFQNRFFKSLTQNEYKSIWATIVFRQQACSSSQMFFSLSIFYNLRIAEQQQ